MMDLPLVEGWVWYAYAMESDGWLNFSGVKREGRGYLAQEVERLMGRVKK